MQQRIEEIERLFEQLEELVSREHDLMEWQELRIRMHKLYSYVWDRRGEQLQQAEPDVPLLQLGDNEGGVPCGQCGDGVYWKLEDDVLLIGGTGPMWRFGSPPQGLTPLWRGAELDAIVIGNGVTSIGSNAFYGVTAPTVVIPASVKTVGSCAFYDAEITTLTLPETVKTIEPLALCGMRRSIHALTVSADIPNIRPQALLASEDAVADYVMLTGERPSDLTALTESELFGDLSGGTCCPDVYYPRAWDDAPAPFRAVLLERLAEKARTDTGRELAESLERMLIPFDLSELL